MPDALTHCCLLSFFIVDQMMTVNAERLQASIVLSFRLGAPIIVGVDLPKVLDVNTGKSDFNFCIFNLVGFTGLGRQRTAVNKRAKTFYCSTAKYTSTAF
jgi:hypothetical protein